MPGSPTSGTIPVAVSRRSRTSRRESPCSERNAPLDAEAAQRRVGVRCAERRQAPVGHLDVNELQPTRDAFTCTRRGLVEAGPVCRCQACALDRHVRAAVDRGKQRPRVLDSPVALCARFNAARRSLIHADLRRVRYANDEEHERVVRADREDWWDSIDDARRAEEHGEVDAGRDSLARARDLSGAANLLFLTHPRLVRRERVLDLQCAERVVATASRGATASLSLRRVARKILAPRARARRARSPPLRRRARARRRRR